MENDLVKKFRHDGYLLVENVFDQPTMARARDDIDQDLHKWHKIMSDRGREKEAGAVAHHVLVEQHWVNFLAVLEPFDLFKKLLNSQPVINTFGVLDNSINSTIYVNNDHIDQRFIVNCSETLMINILIFVDDFTAENGATWIYPRTHLPASVVSGQKQMTGTSGSVLIWDSRLLHRAGTNSTGKNRRAISAMITRPWIKPQFDYMSNAQDNSFDIPNEKAMQLLGGYCQLNRSLDDWYSNGPDKRYRREQDGWCE
jgi:ectoine hydroxylase-related dioxygenase (phytanoyl-CoA dioxygenase family)